MSRIRFSMSRLHIYFFRGLITILPVALTLYLLFIFLTWSEDLTVSVLRPFIGEFYFPGLGLLLGILFIVVIGYLVSKQSIRGIVQFIERPFTNIPVIKSIYSSLKSFADYFSPNDKPDTQQVVIVRHPNYPVEVVGLVTRRHMRDLPEGFLPGERVAVYLPMGYMIGGYTMFLPAEWTHPINMTVEEAMRSSLIAWMAPSEDAEPPRTTTADATQPEPEAAPEDPATETPPEPEGKPGPAPQATHREADTDNATATKNPADEAGRSA